jgi:FAD/FMN-containing dehydrogenase/Fe-S oxidoreductase
MQRELEELNEAFDGSIFWDSIHKAIYATDASVYREEPLAVAFPLSENDLVKLIGFAKKYNSSLIPRTAGTSLAGQVVGNGIIVDFSRHMTSILELNKEERWIWVEPGVNLDELNQFLKPHGLFFGPETSTANRCMIGGMLGNNACGLHSLVYGSTRDHTLSVKCLLSDGSKAEFKAIEEGEYQNKIKIKGLEGDIYRKLDSILSDPINQESIRDGFPHPDIPRRNTGYALDLLLECKPFKKKGQEYNLSRIIAGSEGTLAISTAVKLNLLPLPPSEKALICAHFSSINESLKANLKALETRPTAIELMDSSVLECARKNKSQAENSFFIEGHPRAILIIEQLADTREELDEKVGDTIKSIRDSGFGYAYPVVYGDDCSRVWNLRKAGLGLLANIPGDAKSVSVIEDTAVPVIKLPEYIDEVDKLFAEMDMECVYHAHVGTGELHLRPVLNLKDRDDVRKFRQIASEIVSLVKKYRGSLSGEHGDGRLRTPFIPIILGDLNYKLLKQVKEVFDPDNIFNPGKIVDPAPMDQFLRYEPGAVTQQIDTIFDFSVDQGIIRSIEKCNGSGDCRKSHLIGGTMCPSFQASRDERQTTRARANILREFISKKNGRNPFNHAEIFEILDLCLSCKACKSECPSTIDMAKLKAEFLQHWYDANGVPFRTRMIANITRFNKFASVWPGLFNILLNNKGLSSLFKTLSGFAKDRSLPEISTVRTDKWASANLVRINPAGKEVISEVCLFIDEFTNFNEAGIGIKTIKLLTGLGYRVVLPPLTESGRAYISKGLVRKARKITDSNVRIFSEIIDDTLPLVGIEPSAILSFRDEYPELASEELRPRAKKLAANTFMLDEFIEREIKNGNIKTSSFTSKPARIKLHGHCQQKAVASTRPTLFALNFPENYTAVEIPSGCCGMAGSFGYEKEHFDLSMKVGELVLFPEVRKTPEETIICAYGTSCRHQIKDGTGRKSYHPAEILFEALKQ